MTTNKSIEDVLEDIFNPRSFRCNNCGLNSLSYCSCESPEVDYRQRTKYAIQVLIQQSKEEERRMFRGKLHSIYSNVALYKCGEHLTLLKLINHFKKDVDSLSNTPKT